jgi:hypothetical protein
VAFCFNNNPSIWDQAAVVYYNQNETLDDTTLTPLKNPNRNQSSHPFMNTCTTLKILHINVAEL